MRHGAGIFFCRRAAGPWRPRKSRRSLPQADAGARKPQHEPGAFAKAVRADLSGQSRFQLEGCRRDEAITTTSLRLHRDVVPGPTGSVTAARDAPNR